MDTSELKRWMEEEMDRCVQEVEGGGSIIPRFIGINDRRELFVMMTPWDSEADKVRALFHVKLFFAWKEVTAYIMVSEAWVVTREAGSTDTRQPADCEDREERIIINGVTHGWRGGLSSGIARDGDVVACQVPQWMDPRVGMEGRMTQLLPPEGVGPPPPHIERQLREMFAGFPQGEVR